MNDSIDHIKRFVSSVRNRQQLQWSWLCSSVGLTISSGIGCVLGVIRYVSDGSIGWPLILGVILVGPFVGLVFSIVRYASSRKAAVTIDRRAGLKDRIQTSLSFAASEVEVSQTVKSVRQLQIEDASNHVRSLQPELIVPLRQSKWFPAGIATSAIALATLMFSNPVSSVVAELTPSSAVTHSATQTELGLEELRAVQKETQDPELEKLLQEMAKQIEELKRTDMDPKEALAKLSEMETALEQMQAKVTDPSLDAALQQVGDALSLSESMAAAGEAMAKGQMEKAVEQLAKLAMPNLDRKTEKAVTDKLNELQKNEGASTPSQKSLKDAIAQVSQALSQGDRSRFKDGVDGLAGECKKQGQRKKLSDLLRKQCQCLSECKSECEGECKSSAESNKKGGKKAGRGASGNEAGDKTDQLKSSNEMNLKGQDSGQGVVDVETTDSPEQEQQAVREYRQKASEYEALSESVLASESIPLGQRQTIRKYFESIRPGSNELQTEASK